MSNITRKFAVFAVLAVLACCCLELANSLPVANLRCMTVNSTQTNAKRSIQQSAGIIPGKHSTMRKIDGPIMDLLEEISRLKVELVPNDLAKTIPDMGTAQNTVARKNNLEQTNLSNRSIAAANSGYRLLCCPPSLSRDRKPEGSPPKTQEAESGVESVAEFELSENGLLSDLELIRLQKLIDRLVKA